MDSKDLGIKILRLSSDGDDLSSYDLFLVQELVNGHLLQSGIDRLQEVLKLLQKGDYSDWYFGIVGLHLALDCHVWWSGERNNLKPRIVEHYTFHGKGGNYGSDAKASTIRLVERLKDYDIALSQADCLTEEFKNRIASALLHATRYGGFDEANHKAWALDQMVRILCGCEVGVGGYMPNDTYLEWVASVENNGMHIWSKGVTP